ncbi:MAG: HD domain-containing protein [Desulfobacteraceae bacterium]|nr:HD domain-containing protein [Desulfobacteraceae bacterium]
MMISLMNFRATIRHSKELFIKTDKRIRFLSISHQILMILFLVGYLVVFYSIVQNVSIFGSALVGAIFFFGAVFVFMGNSLQADMLSSIRHHNDALATRNRQLLQTESVTIFTLAYQAELRDQETGKHIERTSRYVRMLAEELSTLPKYKDYLTPQYIEDLEKAAPLHDIGKVGIPDSILKKPGKLTDAEFAIIMKHCEYGTKVLKIADEKLSFQSFLKIAIQMVQSHHEKWDGEGYPQGLNGADIPLSGRIMAVADVYDALRSERCYKKGFSHTKTCEILREERGKHFDPDLIDAFFKVEAGFEVISNSLQG